MIPSNLERAILKGWATYSKYTHAMGMFGAFRVPENKILFIVDIKWHQFINPYLNDGSISIAEFFKYNEYQLKIEGGKSTNYLTYRNQINFNVESLAAGGILNTNDTILTALNYGLFTTGAPIIQDVYFICEKYVQLTISRNCLFEVLASDYGLLNPQASQQDAPNGVKNIPVLKRLTMQSVDGNTMYYTPPTDINSGLSTPAGGRNAEGYIQDLDVTNSQIYPVQSGFNAVINRPTLTQPLVELGIVTINSNDFDKLQNS